MTDLQTLFPRQSVPDLTLPLAGGGHFALSSETPAHFTMIVFYRGLHCPICHAQLRDLETKLPEFERRGVSVVAASSDIAERAEQAKADWKLPGLRIGYGLPLAEARHWGLFVSAGRGKTSAGIEEPARFSEPGLFLIRPDRTLYFASVQTMPFSRPHFADVLTAIDFVVAKDYPARGEIPSLTA